MPETRVDIFGMMNARTEAPPLSESRSDSVPGGPIVADNFDRADGALGTNWTAFSGTLAIQSNKCVNLTASDGAYNWVPSVTTDHFVSAYCYAIYDGTADRTAEIRARVSSGGNRIRFYQTTDLAGTTIHWTVRIEKAYTLAEAAFTFDSPTDRWGKIEVLGSVATFYTSADGTNWTLRHTYDDTGLNMMPTTGVPGIDLSGGGNGSNYLDDFNTGAKV